MNCKRITGRLSAYLDGELSPRAAERLEAHLGACPACAAQLQGLRHLHHALEGYGAPVADESLARRVRLAAEARREAGDRSRIVPFMPVLARAAAGVLFAAGVAAGLVAGSAAVRPAVPQAHESEIALAQLDVLSVATPGSVADIVLASLGETQAGGTR